MRRCFKIDYHEGRTESGMRVALKPVKCAAIPTLRSSVKWPNGSTQHTYTCEEHADALRVTTEDAGFPWEPRPYSPSK